MEMMGKIRRGLMLCMGRRVDVQEADPPNGGATGAQDIMRWVASQLPR